MMPMPYFDRNKDPGDCGCRANLNTLLFGSGGQKISFFKTIIGQHGINTVLDVFCETGDLAVSLARLVKNVTALVPEPILKKEITLKSAQAGINLDLYLGDMRDISSIYRKRSDLIICLQNSLALLLNEKDIWGTLAQMFLKLEPGGVLVIHTLNYDRLSKTESCFLPIPDWHRRNFETEPLYRQDKEGRNASLTANFFPGGDAGGQGKKLTFPVRPILTKELNLWLAELGFEKIEHYDWYDWKAYTSSSFHRITVACRPGAVSE